MTHSSKSGIHPLAEKLPTLTASPSIVDTQFLFSETLQKLMDVWFGEPFYEKIGQEYTGRLRRVGEGDLIKKMSKKHEQHLKGYLRKNTLQENQMIALGINHLYRSALIATIEIYTGKKRTIYFCLEYERLDILNQVQEMLPDVDFSELLQEFKQLTSQEQEIAAHNHDEEK